ncbi:MAG: hypothetical protein IKA42_06750 [Clostridia bacterium]|nr:hypothetical protein [Clostridia bacterium]
MFSRIKALTLMQLGNKFKFRRVADKKNLVLKLFFKTLSIFATVAVTFLLLYVIKNVIFLPVNRTTFVFLLFISQIISLIACSLGLVESLYYGKDNQILMSFPAKHHEVFISKLTVYYINELLKNLYFVVPMFIAFGFINGMGVFYYPNAMVLTFLLSFIPVLLGSLISVAIMGIKQLAKRASWIGIILTFGIMVLLFWLANVLIGSLERPIRLIEVYNAFVTQTVLFMQRINDFALVYNNFVQTAFNINLVANYLIISGVIICLALLVVLVSMPIYFKMASFGNEHSVTKKHKHKQSKRKSVFLALLNKEFTLIKRSANQFVQDYILVVSMPLVLYLLNGFYWAMAPSVNGIEMIVAFNLFVSLLLLTASNTQTASAISAEGSEFGLLKTSPSDTKQVAWAKMISNFAVSTLFIVASVLMLFFAKNVTKYYLWQTAVVLVLINSGHILWSFQLDLRNPQFAEYSQKKAGAENVNKSRSVVAGMAMAVIVALVTVFFMMIDNSASPWSRIIGFSAGFFALRLVLFIFNLKVYFREIEA